MSEHHQSQAGGKALQMAFILNISFTIIEFIGGYWTNSVAIMSDAVHDLGDSLAIGVAYFLGRYAMKRADYEYSYGYGRYNVLGALVNSGVLLMGSVFILKEAFSRVLEPQSTHAEGMVGFAILGVLVNGYAAWNLKTKGDSLNEKAVSLHLMEDMLGWVAVLIGAIVMLFFDVPRLDPILSISITIYILIGAVGRLREAIRVLLQRVPEGVDLKELEANLAAIQGVQSLHETHTWSMDGQTHVFSTHLEVDPGISMESVKRIKNEARDILRAYPFVSHTVEIEFKGIEDHDLLGMSDEQHV
ncbi:MAG: hypothetical protein RL754_409 [Bacteroidota bacterium]|jgi:cobalt-zinc-cadmium efflux system protein